MRHISARAARTLGFSAAESFRVAGFGAAPERSGRGEQQSEGRKRRHGPRSFVHVASHRTIPDPPSANPPPSPDPLPSPGSGQRRPFYSMSAEGPGSFLAHIDRSGARGQAPAPYLGILADICDIAIGPSRELDAQIALALYPGLLDLKEAKCGVWLEPDGNPITAPRYSSCPIAAKALVPEGCRIAREPKRPIEILAAHGGEPVGTGYHRDDALAILAAALRAHAALRLLPPKQRDVHGGRRPVLARIENGSAVRAFPFAYRDASTLNLSAQNDDGNTIDPAPGSADAPPIQALAGPPETAALVRIAVISCAMALGLAALILFILP